MKDTDRRWRHGGTGQDTMLNAILVSSAIIGLLVALVSAPTAGPPQAAQSPATAVAIATLARGDSP